MKKLALIVIVAALSMVPAVTLAAGNGGSISLGYMR